MTKMDAKIRYLVLWSRILKRTTESKKNQCNTSYLSRQQHPTTSNLCYFRRSNKELYLLLLKSTASRPRNRCLTRTDKTSDIHPRVNSFAEGSTVTVGKPNFDSRQTLGVYGSFGLAYISLLLTAQ